MEEEILNQENVKTKPVTPDMVFSVLDGDHIDPNNLYEISDEELEKLGKHELKWANENGKPILIPNDPTEENRKREASLRISELKKLLADSDYQAIKYAEGLIVPSEYAPIKAKREMWRKEINDLEKLL